MVKVLRKVTGLLLDVQDHLNDAICALVMAHYPADDPRIRTLIVRILEVLSWALNMLDDIWTLIEEVKKGEGG